MSYTEIATPMPLLPLTYTRDAAPCPTFLDRTGEAVRSTGGGVCGGRCEAKATPHYLNLRNIKNAPVRAVTHTTRFNHDRKN